MLLHCLKWHQMFVVYNTKYHSHFLIGSSWIPSNFNLFKIFLCFCAAFQPHAAAAASRWWFPQLWCYIIITQIVALLQVFNPCWRQVELTTVGMGQNWAQEIQAFCGGGGQSANYFTFWDQNLFQIHSHTKTPCCFSPFPSTIHRWLRWWLVTQGRGEREAFLWLGHKLSQQRILGWTTDTVGDRKLIFWTQGIQVLVACLILTLSGIWLLHGCCLSPILPAFLFPVLPALTLKWCHTIIWLGS